ncbi:MAG: M20 family metallopeptidase [Elusimicrobiota bacterium]
MKSLKEKLITIRRTIHRYPELGYQEYRTSAFIEKILRSTGIKTKRVTKTGIVGILEGARSGKCVALRGDIDALPVNEMTGRSFASQRRGVMHACGHDANTAMVLGAAMLLSRKKNRMRGAVKFIFQPNEESSGGASRMIKAGALKNPKADAILGIHVYPWLKTGTVGLKYGYMMAAVDKFTIEILGEGGHGAYPHKGKDAVVIASHVIQALQSLVSREVNPVDPFVLTIGMIEGGEKFNILPGAIKMTGTVRTLDARLHKAVPRMIEEKVAAITRAFGAGYRFDFKVLGGPLKNSREFVDLCGRAADTLKMNKVIMENPSMGGEDFSEYLKTVPGCFIYVGSGRAVPWHHEKFDIDENVLPKGAALLAEAAGMFLG